MNLNRFVELSNNNNIDVLLLEHPLLILTLRLKSLLNKYKNIIKNINNNFKYIDFDNFLDYCLEAAALVAKPNSLMSEFSITNNPIFALGDYNDLNQYGEDLAYNKESITNWNELSKYLNKLKHKNKITLKSKINSSAFLIEFIKKDFEHNYSDYFKQKLGDVTKQLTKIEKILVQGYYEDIIDKTVYNMDVINSALKNWSDEISRLKSTVDKDNT